jgi:hypothetical protein
VIAEEEYSQLVRSCTSEMVSEASRTDGKDPHQCQADLREMVTFVFVDVQGRSLDVDEKTVDRE